MSKSERREEGEKKSFVESRTTCTNPACFKTLPKNQSQLNVVNVVTEPSSKEESRETSRT